MTNSLATIEPDATSSRTLSRSGPTASVLTEPRITATTGQELLGGARAMLPWLVGVIPFGLVIGVTIAESSVSPLAGVATGSTIYAGSAQLATVQLLDRGAAPLAIILTALIINARLLAYSGSMAIHWRGTGRPFRRARLLPPRRSFLRGRHGRLRESRARAFRSSPLPRWGRPPLDRLAVGDPRGSDHRVRCPLVAARRVRDPSVPRRAGRAPRRQPRGRARPPWSPARSPSPESPFRSTADSSSPSWSASRRPW